MIQFVSAFAALQAAGFTQSLITTYVGPQLPSSGAPALTQAIDSPASVAPDGSGGFYVSSTYQNRVYHVDSNGTMTFTAGSSYGFGGDGGPAIEAKLGAPSGLALDSAGNLYIADTNNNRIREVLTDGSIRTVAGTGVSGFSGDGGTATSAQLAAPDAVAVDAGGNLYIADTNNMKVRKVTIDGQITTIATSQIPAPVIGVAVDVAGNVYLSDGVVNRVAPNGVMTTVVPSTPSGTFNATCLNNGDGGPASSSSICNPDGLATDSAGNLYISAAGLFIRKVDANGIITTVAGNGVLGSSGDGGPATSAAIRPAGIAIDAAGNLFIAQFPDHHVRMVTPGGIISTVAGMDIAGFAGDGGPATSAKISGPLNGFNSGPMGVAADASGNVYIADTGNNAVRLVTPASVINTLLQISDPVDVVVDASGNVDIASGAAGGSIVQVAPNGSMRTLVPDLGGNTPTALALDDSGSLYISRRTVISKVSSDGSLQTLAVSASSGSQSFNSLGIAVDHGGNVYISDQTYHRILKLNGTGSFSTVAGGNAFSGSSFCDPAHQFVGDGGPASAAGLCFPAGIRFDTSGNLYIADVGNFRIRKIALDATISTMAGNGYGGFSGDGGSATGAQINNQAGIGLDPSGNLYIADTLNARIRKIFTRSSSTQSFNFGSFAGESTTTTALPGPITDGYGTIQPTAGDATPSGVAIFSYTLNGVLVSETAVPASPLLQSGRIFAESASSVRTGIAIANPGTQDANVSFYFTDQNGSSSAVGSTTLPAQQQIAVFLDQMPFKGTISQGTFTFTSTDPVGAIALRAFVNERGETLLTTLPVAPTASAVTAPVVVPHYAIGAGWTTQLLLVNPTDGPINGTVNYDTAYTYSIPARSSTKIVSTGSNTLQSGNIIVTPAPGSTTPVVSTVFLLTVGGITTTESGVATTGDSTSFRLLAELNSAQNLQTGIAIANTTANTANLQFELLTLNGGPTGLTGSTTLGANGHLPLFLDQIPGMQNVPASFQGVLHISSDQPISAIGLRLLYNQRGDLVIATTPAIADTETANAGEYVFPQVTTGGGFTTQIILMNSATPSQGTLSLTSQNGTHLPLFGP